MCQVGAENDKVLSTDEGELKWFSDQEIITGKEDIIPSDYYMLTEILQKQEAKQLVEVEMIQEKERLILTRLLEY